MANIVDKNTQQLVSFLSGCQVKIDENNKQFKHVARPTVEINNGRRYFRVERVDVSSRSAHCFIDRTNGDILKAAGWKGPAKHKRGNIFELDNGLDCMGPYGAAYLR